MWQGRIDIWVLRTELRIRVLSRVDLLKEASSLQQLYLEKLKDMLRAV